SRRRHTRFSRDWSSDVCSSDLLGAAFAFAIVVSILVDIAVQTNVWRVIVVSGMRAQELGNASLPGLGHLMAFLLLISGLVFNVRSEEHTYELQSRENLVCRLML